MVVRKKTYGCPKKNLWLSEKNLMVVLKKPYGCPKKSYSCPEKKTYGCP